MAAKKRRRAKKHTGPTKGVMERKGEKFGFRIQRALDGRRGSTYEKPVYAYILTLNHMDLGAFEKKSDAQRAMNTLLRGKRDLSAIDSAANAAEKKKPSSDYWD